MTDQRNQYPCGARSHDQCPVALKLSGKFASVDRCIADLVRALNDCGHPTVASCCGHGKTFAMIAMADGRELFIAPDYETARRWEHILLASLE